MIRFRQSEGSLTVYLCGEIDHSASREIRRQIEEEIQKHKPQRLILDFSSVSFMDSSGVGMLIGRYRSMMQRNGSVCAVAMSEPVERLFRMAGLHRIITILEKEGRTAYEK